MNRRSFVTSLAASASSARAESRLPPVRAITRGPRFHWFGYYDKLQFDPTSRYALGVSNDFQHRLPTDSDALKIGMVDLEDGDRWIDLGETTCWSWHQTCMLQWLPGSKDEVIWNSRQGTDFVSTIMNVRTGRKRTLPKPIYCVSQDARWALVNDFARSFNLRGSDTGYAGGLDPYADEAAPAKSGLWRMDLRTGAFELILSLAEVAKISSRNSGSGGTKHYFDLPMIAPDGKRFACLQRWKKGAGEPGSHTRVWTASPQGTDLRLIDDTSLASHYNWRDPETLLLFTTHPSHGPLWYLVNERTLQFAPLDKDVMTQNGHISMLRGGRWILSDTGPDKERKQHQYLYDTKARRKVELGGFYSPPEYKGIFRCDTTPRASPDGRKVIFDSPHDGKGRQMYLIDVGKLVG